MKGFYLSVSNGLLDPKHVKTMGSSVWEFMWCLDKITQVDEEGIGFVLGGRPIKLKELKEELGKAETHISQNLKKLKEAGYLDIKLAPHGLIIRVMKAKKRFNEKVKGGFTKRLKEDDEKVKPIYIDNSNIYNDNNTLSTNVDKDKSEKTVSIYGNQDINLVAKYFLEKLQIPKEDCTQSQSRQYWSLLLKEVKKGEPVAGVKWLIDQVVKDDFFKNNISSGKDLYYKRTKIIMRARGNKPKIAVMPTKGGEPWTSENGELPSEVIITGLPMMNSNTT